MMRRAVGGAMVALAGCAALAAGAAPAVARSHRPTRAAACTPQHVRAISRSARVLVYTTPTGIDAFSGGPVTTYYACLRPAGRPVAIGHSVGGSGEYPANVELSDLRISGTFVTDESASGFASEAACGKYDPGPACDDIVKYRVEIADVAARRTVKLPVPGSVSSLALSPRGAAAWVVSSGSSSSTLYAVVVRRAGHGSLVGRPSLIDTGPMITSVSFNGSTLRWSNAGQRERRTVS